MVSFGHIVIEGYCMHDDNNTDIVPCKGINIVSAKCFLENHTICKFFGWCEAKNLIVMTNETGDEIICRTYDAQNKEELKSLFLDR